MGKKQAAAPPTKKHLARAERERRQRRWILTGSVAALAAALGLVAFAVLREQVIIPRLPIVTVDGEKVLTMTFQERVRLVQRNLLLEEQYLLQISGTDPQVQQFYDQQLESVRSQLSNSFTIGNQVLNALIEEQLIALEANKRGISVSEDEVDRLIAAQVFGYFPEGTPTPTPTRTPDLTLEAMESATPSATASPDPTELAQATATATASATATSTSTPTPGPSPTPTSTGTAAPTATPFTREAFEQAYRTYIHNLRTAGIGEATLKGALKADLYRRQLLESFQAEVPRAPDQIWLRFVRADGEEKAGEIAGRLKAGEAWDQVLEGYTSDPESGVSSFDLGWQTTRLIESRFDVGVVDAVQAAEVGEIVGPLETFGSWAMFKVLGHEPRVLTDVERQDEAQAVFGDWLAERHTEADIVIVADWEERIPPPPPGYGGESP